MVAVFPANIYWGGDDWRWPPMKKSIIMIATMIRTWFHPCQGGNQAMDVKGEVKRFDLGLADISQVFHIPDKLYGRDQEIQ